MPDHTPSQTIGPFFSHALTPESNRFPPIVDNRVRFSKGEGPSIELRGAVRDGEGNVITDAMVEIFQSNADGVFETGHGYGRSGTENGEFVFRTVKPGTREPDMSPCIEVVLFMRGLLNHLFTRIYFADEKELNERDRFLSQLSAETRERLLATSESDGVYRFDINMQGPDETPFIDR